MRTVLVDAENVRRSIWPNVGADELVRLCDERLGDRVDLIVVFDGESPGIAAKHVRVVCESGRSADDLIAELAAASDGELEVATSDRGLRARLPQRATVVGGGTFVRTLLGHDR